MSEVAIGYAAALSRDRRDRAVLGVVFVLMFVFSYSADIVAVFFEITHRDDALEWGIALVAIDIAILAVVGLLMRAIERAEGSGPRSRPSLRAQWWTACGVVVALNVITSALPEDHPLWMDLLASVAFALTTGVLMAVALNADPMTLFSAARRAALPVDWVRVRAVVPLIIGTFASFLAATAFDDFFDLDTVRTLEPEMAAEIADLPMTQHMAALANICEGAVSPDFFHQMVGVTAVLLLALGVEFNYFRRTLIDPVQRAATAATAAMMATGLVLALSTLPFDGSGCGDVASYWHEYLTFAVAIQGVATGLATLIWLLVSGTPDSKATPDIEAQSEAASD